MFAMFVRHPNHSTAPPLVQTTRWAFGGSCRAPVVNLSSSTSQLMVYGAAQCAVIYDYGSNTQRILQGHVSERTAELVSGEAACWLGASSTSSCCITVLKGS